MSDLRNEKLVESHRRVINEPAVWRLTLKGKKLMGMTKRRVAPLGYRIPHYTGIVDTLVWLLLNGQLGDSLEVEPRYELKYKGKMRIYQPDACFTWNKKTYYLEYQSHRTNYTAKEWADKWIIRKEFYKKTLWKNKFKSEPTIIVLTKQRSKIVKNGSENLPMIVLKDISDLKGWYEL